MRPAVAPRSVPMADLLQNKPGRVYKTSMRPFTDNQGCFVCGKLNPSGLKLHFSTPPEHETTESAVVFPETLQGWEQTVHGGLVATVLDEMLVQAAAARGLKCITAEITVKFKKPVAIGQPYKITGRVTGIRGRIVCAESELLDGDGKTVAASSGKLFRL